MKLTAAVIKNIILFSVQSEIENIALENAGTAEDIYFNKIPITSEFYVQFDQAFKAWRLHSYPTTNNEKKEISHDEKEPS